MKVVIDIEANGLHNPTKIWLVVCKDIDTGVFHCFRNPSIDQKAKEDFLKFSQDVKLWIGHNLLEYDYPVLNNLLGLEIKDIGTECVDTLILSRLIDYSRPSKHSIEAYGEEFGIPKGNFRDWTKWSQEMEDYCVRDVEITHLVYKKYHRYISNPERSASIRTEHEFQFYIVNSLHANGFSFNTEKAEKLLAKVKAELATLDEAILKEFPPRSKLIREVTPKATKHGTISLISIPKALRSDIEFMSIDEPFSYFEFEAFNPASHKQIVEVLHRAGWSPVDKTQTHIDNDREIKRLKYTKQRNSALDLALKVCEDKAQSLIKYGWKINEANLNTLPSNAPSPARTLAKRILLEARRRTLTEWLGLVRPGTARQEDSRIHGKFYGIGAWTHRMAHQNPNTANIPTEAKLYGHEMRALWRAPKNRLLVGVDAEGIQLRIFAHYIDDPEFTDALVKGKKDDKTDPHSLNQRILGDVCKSRAIAKRFIYALLLGAGLPKLAQILECSVSDAEEALGRLIERYTGFATLKETTIPADAKRGWFVGLDGRAVKLPGDSLGSRRHLAMSGYLQNGEAVVMKLAALKWRQQILNADKWEKELREALLVNFVHDEWQTEIANNLEAAHYLAEIQSNALREVGEDLKLKCPLAGSFWNDDLKKPTIGTNWSVTH